MSYTIEKVLSDARLLVNRLKDHDSSAETLINRATMLNKRIDAMKTYQEDLNELNEIARHRPRSALIMNLAQENSQIRELQLENRELNCALEEHQSALELIMSKYREQVCRLLLANRLDNKSANPPLAEQDTFEKIDKISEMAAVMQKAANLEDERAAKEEALLHQLQLENRNLRELLHITARSSQFCATENTDVQTQTQDKGSGKQNTEVNEPSSKDSTSESPQAPVPPKDAVSEQTVTKDNSQTAKP